MPDSRTQTVIGYHQQTKHHFQRMARSLGYLDWATQPDPFRRFSGAEVNHLPFDREALPHEREAPPLERGALPLGRVADSPAYEAIFEPGAMPPAGLNAASLGAFLEYSLALSAWKEFRGNRWALRINPSSGNLHPTEGYVICPAVPGLTDQPGVFHYAPREHALERRCRFNQEVWETLARGLPPGAFFAGLTSIHWREAWKYGERAWRYCQHDVGHAVAALALSAAVQGWTVCPLPVADPAVAALLGLDRDEDFADAEREEPDLLIAVLTQTAEGTGPNHTGRVAGDAIAAVAASTWTGRANRLSDRHVPWPIIEEVTVACRREEGRGVDEAPAKLAGGRSVVTETSADKPEPAGASLPVLGPRSGVRPMAAEQAADAGCPASAKQIIRQRRSAVEMDGQTSISAASFFQMMSRVMPRFDAAPWTALGPPACVHLGLFVHRVDGLPRGLYVLVRDSEQVASVRVAMNSSFLWTMPDGVPPELPLYLLMEGDARQAAWRVSCDQAIAAEGAFSCGMIARFEPSLNEHGPWFYRRLFWETGMIGQVLYLEAEAGGVRATGIGCFYDDPVHELFGLRGTAYQSLYHFTVGGPVDDPRLTTLPPYPGERTGMA